VAANYPGTTRRREITVVVGIIAMVTLLRPPGAAECAVCANTSGQKLDTVEAAVDYKRSLTELLVQLEAYLGTSKAALEKAKALRDAGIVTESEVQTHVASVESTSSKVAATKAKIAEVDAALSRMSGSSANPSPAANRTSSAGVQSLDVPFDTSVERLAANYQGHQPTALANLLPAHDVVKDEFETTDQFSDRIRSKLPSGTLALQMDPLADDLAINYNADRQVMSLVVTASLSTFWRPSAVRVASDWAYSEELSFVRVSRLDRGTFPLIIACRELSGFELTRTQAKWTTELPMKPDEARLLKPRLRVLVIGKVPKESDLKYLFVREEFKGHAVGFVLQHIWLYDVSTGTVLAKGNFTVRRPPPQRK
jgi:hypothetical protein